jgi:class 3 adenylate cyclase
MNFLSIEKKILNSFIKFFFVPLGIMLLVIGTSLYFYFDYIEKNQQYEILNRLEKKLNKDIVSLSNLLFDWVDYDAPVRYFKNQYPTFVEEEFKISVKNLNLQLFASINKNNTLKEIYFFDRSGNYTTLPEDLKLFFQSQNIKHLPKREMAEYGILGYNNNSNFLYFAARGVLLYKENYKNSYGTLVFGKIIDEKILKEYEIDIGFPIKIIPYNNQIDSNKNKFIKTNNFFSNSGYLLIYDYLKKPAFYFYIDFPRKLISSSLSIIALVLLIIFMISLFSFFLLKKDIHLKFINRIISFTNEIEEIRKNPDSKKQIHLDNLKSIDEIVILKERFNSMLKEIQIKEELNKKYLQLVELEKEKAYDLLLNILPKKIAQRMYQIQEKGDNIIIADEFTEASILFADIANFTGWSKNLEPKELVLHLNQLFTQFDFITEKHNIEKIKTIGDNYMAASGIPDYDINHADNIILFALEMLKILNEFNSTYNLNISIRIGINSGKVVAGVIGAKKFIYDVWGDTVNLASKLESSGIANTIQISEFTFNALKNQDLKNYFSLRGTLKLKSGHSIKTYLLNQNWENLIVSKI